MDNFRISSFQKRNRRLMVKVITLFASVSFLLPYMGFAFNASIYSSNYPTHSLIKYLGKPIAIPKPLGTITRGFQGQDKMVICIEDLHCNYEVQKNIAKIIRLLAKEHDLKLVAEEGAFSSVDINPIRSFPIPEIRKAVSDYFVKQGKLTGAEFYAATGKYPVKLEGIETPKLYQDSMAAVHSFMNAESQGYVMDLREMLNTLKPAVYNQALSALDQASTDYREGKLDVLAYATKLKNFAGRLLGEHRSPLRQYPNLENYLHLSRKLFEPGVEPDQLFHEMDALDQALREKLYTTNLQRELDAQSHRLDVIEKLLNISATQEELQEFRNGREKFRVGKFVEFIQTVWNGPRMRGAQRDRSLQPDHEIDPSVYTLDHYLGA